MYQIVKNLAQSGIVGIDQKLFLFMTEIQPDVFCFRRILEVEAEEVDSLDDIYGLYSNTYPCFSRRMKSRSSFTS